jgi:hypothetical protein
LGLGTGPFAKLLTVRQKTSKTQLASQETTFINECRCVFIFASFQSSHVLKKDIAILSSGIAMRIDMGMRVALRPSWDGRDNAYPYGHAMV